MTRDSIVTTAKLHNRRVDVELLPRSAYETAYTAAVGTIGFAFETQCGTHALGSDRRVPFYTRANTLAYLPEGCDVYSQSSGGGEYLHIRLPDWAPANARQFNDVLAPQAIRAAHAIRRALLTAPDAGEALETAIVVLAEAVSGALAPEHAPASRSRSLTSRRLKLIDALIEERMQERVAVADLAAAVGLSVGFLIRAFRAEVGITPHAYVMDRRMSRARQLLSLSSMPIAGVAAACGFASQAHLATACKRSFNMTPAALRSASQGLSRRSELMYPPTLFYAGVASTAPRSCARSSGLSTRGGAMGVPRSARKKGVCL